MADIHDDTYWNDLLNNTDNYRAVLDVFFSETSEHFNGQVDIAKSLQVYYSTIYNQLRDYGFNYNTNPWLVFLTNYYITNRAFNFTSEQYSLLNKQFDNNIISQDELTGKTTDGFNNIYYNPTLYREQGLQDTNYKILIYSWFKSTYSVESWCNNYTLLAAISDDINLDEYNNLLKQGNFTKANELVRKHVKFTRVFCDKLLALCFTQDITRITNSQYIRNKAQRDSHIIQIYEVKHIDINKLDRKSNILDARLIEQNINTLHVSYASSDAKVADEKEPRQLSSSVKQLVNTIKQSNYSPYDVLYVLSRQYDSDTFKSLQKLNNFNSSLYAQAKQMTDDDYYRIKKLVDLFEFNKTELLNAYKSIIALED